MRILIASLFVAPLSLVGLVAASAHQSISADPPAEVLAYDAPTAEQATYTQKAQGDVKEWQRKLQNFNAKAEASGRKDLASAEQDLHIAWNKTEAETKKLQAASTADWDSVKRSYEQASDELAADWERIRPEDK